MRFRLVENIVYEASSKEVKKLQSSANKAAKDEFQKLAQEQQLDIKFAKNSVAHHIYDTRGAIGTKNNSITNYIFIPNVSDDSQYAQFIHKLLHLKQSEFSSVDLTTFIKRFLNESLYSVYTDGKIYSTRVADYLK